MDLETKWTAYSRGPEGLDGRLKAVPEGLWAFRPGPGKWTVHEIVLHLADSEAQSYLRFRTAIAEPGNLVMDCRGLGPSGHSQRPGQDFPGGLAGHLSGAYSAAYRANRP